MRFPCFKVHIFPIGFRLFYFLTEFFKYFFRVLHEASSSWLKCLHNFQKHPVYVLCSYNTSLSAQLTVAFCLYVLSYCDSNGYNRCSKY
jgi:hypothetical protein